MFLSNFWTTFGQFLQELWQFQKNLCTFFEEPFCNFCKTFGQLFWELLIIFWITFWQFLDNFGVVFGQLRGQFLDNFWSSSKNFRSVFGEVWYSFWITMGQFLEKGELRKTWPKHGLGYILFSETVIYLVIILKYSGDLGHSDNSHCSQLAVLSG